MVIRINVHSAGENPTYTTRTLPMKLHIRPAYASCGQSLYMATFHESSVDLDGSHCSREKGLPTQSTARQLIDPRVRTQFLSQANQWSSRLKPSLYRWQDTRLSGLISPACDRYIQYLLTGPTHWSLINAGGGYNLGGAGFPHTTARPSQPVVSPFHLGAPSGLRLSNHSLPSN
jgi:hypothetical protein